MTEGEIRDLVDRRVADGVKAHARSTLISFVALLAFILLLGSVIWTNQTWIQSHTGQIKGLQLELKSAEKFEEFGSTLESIENMVGSLVGADENEEPGE